MNHDSDREKALAALGQLSKRRADDRDDWLTVGMALHSVSPDLLTAWDSWSQQSEKFTPNECARQWRSFKASGGVTIGTLLAWSKADSGALPAPKARPRRPAPAEKPKATYPTLDAAIQAMAHVGKFAWERAYPGPHDFHVARFDLSTIDAETGKCKKICLPFHKNSKGFVCLDPPGKLPLYRGDDLPADGPIIVTEGELKADAARSIGLAAVTSAHGCKSAHRSDWTPLRGRQIIILADNDPGGLRYAQDVAAILTALGAVVRIVLLPGLPPKGDLLDYLEARDGQDAETLRAEIEALADAAPIWTPPAETETQDAPDDAEAAPTGDDLGNQPEIFIAIDEPRVVTETVNTPALAADILATESFAVDVGEKLWRYRAGTYRRDGVRHVARMSKAILTQRGQGGQWTTYRTKEVAAYIGADAAELWDRPPLDRLNLANGILDVTARTLHPHTPDFLSPVQLPVIFDPSATCPAWDRFCAEVFPADCADYLFAELAAWLMLPATDIQKAVLLLGDGANGKSTFLAALTRFLGRENVAARTLHALEGNRFATAGLIGKLANIAADLPSRHLADTSTFKALTGTEFAIPAEYKHGAQFDFPCFARLMFSANHPPSAGDASEAFFRRWIVVPFARVFEGKAATPRGVLDAALADKRELSGVLNRALDALPRVLADGIAESPAMRAAWSDLRQATDPLSVFLDTHVLTAPAALVAKAELLAAYNEDARQHGRPLASAVALGMAVKRAWPDVPEAQRTIAGRQNQWAWIGLGLKAPRGVLG
jgi:putative DNA primase/helicase